MSGLSTILIGNALPVVVLSALVYLISRSLGRPALTHLLWVLVLVKLITPPLLPWSVSVSPETAAAMGLPWTPVADDSASAAPAGRTSQGSTALVEAESTSVFEPRPLSRPLDAANAGASAGVPGPSVASTGHSAFGDMLSVIRDRWVLVFMLIWFAGMVVAVAHVGRLLIALRRRLSPAQLVDERTQRHIAGLARSLGLSRVPVLRIVDGVVSPLLWGVGRSTSLVFPKALWDELPASSRDALLLHELAHYRRGDHWVRLLEIVVGCLYWWHPCVWWARHELATAEEECCDAWVVRHAGHHPRSYAEAIIATLDYLAGDCSSLRAVTTGASTMPVLRRRMRQIMHRTVAPSLPNSVRWSVLVVAAVMLPLQPLLQIASEPVVEAALTTPPLFDGAIPIGSDVDLSGPLSSQTVTGTGNSLPPQPQGWWSTRTLAPVSVVLSPDGRYVVERRGDAKISVADQETGLRHDLTDAEITCLVFTPDGRRFITGSKTGDVRLWDAATGQPVSQLGRMEDRVTTIDIAADGSWVVSGSSAGSLLVWELNSGAVLGTWTSDALPIVCVRVIGNRVVASIGRWTHPDSGQLVFLDSTSFEAINAVSTGQILAAIEPDDVSDGNLLLTDYAGDVWSWSPSSASAVNRGTVQRADVSAAAFSSAYRLSTRL